MLSERVLALDPGNVYTGWALIESDGTLVDFDKTANNRLLSCLRLDALPPGRRRADWPAIPPRVAIEMVASYGMAVGATVFETCVWIGRFHEAIAGERFTAELVFRKDVKLHHCGVTKAKDANIRQALIDRFGAGAPNGGKGNKANPGPLYGMAADAWSAFALAVYIADRENGNA